MNVIERRLNDLGLSLPEAAQPNGSYQGYLQLGQRLLLSGQTCRENGSMAFTGRVGIDVSLEEGQQASRICALNLLAQVKQACQGDLDRVERCLRLTIYVNSSENFSDQPKVANAASDLMVTLFGSAGRHVRSAVGVYALPGNSAVEIDAEFLLRAL